MEILSTALRATAVLPRLVSMDSPEQPAPVPDALEAANRAFENARRGTDGASWATARQLYDAFLRNPGAASDLHRAEAQFFMARCFQEERLVPGARHAFTRLLEDKAFASSPYRIEAAFRLGEISYRAGGYDIAIEELERCRTLLRADRTPAAERPEYMRWVVPYLADCHLQAGNYRQARELFAESLTGSPSAAVATFAKSGLARIAVRSFQAGQGATGEEQTRLFGEAQAALRILQRDFAADPITARALRDVAGLAYDHANGTNDRTRWERARSFFTQVHALGASSPHRLDASFFLGWCEYRLGNFTAAATHFGAFCDATTSDPRRAEAVSLRAIVRAEESLRQAGLVTGENAVRDRVQHLQDALTHLAGIDDAGRRDFVRGLALRTARTLLPLLDPVAQGEQFRTTVQSVRTILGDTYQASGLDTLLYNHGRRLAATTDGPTAAADRARGLEFLRTVSTEFPARRSGILASIEVARTGNNFGDLAAASQRLLDHIGALSVDNRPLWLYATTNRIAGLLGTGDVARATETFTGAETALRDAPAAVQNQLRGTVWGHFADAGERIIAKPAPTAAELRSAQQCFQLVVDADGTRGTILRARSVYGLGRTAERQGNNDDALTRYRQILLLYPAMQDGKPAFTGDGFDRVRTSAQGGITRLERR